MRFLRMYSGDDQQTHLEELKLPFESGQFAQQTPLQPVIGATFTRVSSRPTVNWHNAPRRQYVVTLAGAVEIGLGDGSLHRFGPGDVILAEDLTGKGHTTEAVGQEAWMVMIVPLKD